MHLITVDVKVNGQKIRFEIDTGAAMSILSQEDQKKLFPDATLRETSTRLRTYTGDTIRVVGEMAAHVS